MIKVDKQEIEFRGNGYVLGAELSILLCSLKNDNIPLEVFSSAIHTFMHESLTVEEQDELLDQLKILAKYQGR